MKSSMSSSFVTGDGHTVQVDERGVTINGKPVARPAPFKTMTEFYDWVRRNA
jgi:hypothetical protein